MKLNHWKIKIKQINFVAPSFSSMKHGYDMGAKYWRVRHLDTWTNIGHELDTCHAIDQIIVKGFETSNTVGGDISGTRVGHTGTNHGSKTQLILLPDKMQHQAWQKNWQDCISYPSQKNVNFYSKKHKSPFQN